MPALLTRADTIYKTPIRLFHVLLNIWLNMIGDIMWEQIDQWPARWEQRSFTPHISINTSREGGRGQTDAWQWCSNTREAAIWLDTCSWLVPLTSQCGHGNCCSPGCFQTNSKKRKMSVRNLAQDGRWTNRSVSCHLQVPDRAQMLEPSARGTSHIKTRSCAVNVPNHNNGPKSLKTRFALYLWRCGSSTTHFTPYCLLMALGVITAGGEIKTKQNKKSRCCSD